MGPYTYCMFLVNSVTMIRFYQVLLRPGAFNWCSLVLFCCAAGLSLVNTFQTVGGFFTELFSPFCSRFTWAKVRRLCFTCYTMNVGKKLLLFPQHLLVVVRLIFVMLHVITHQ